MSALGDSSSTLQQQQPPQWLQHLTASLEAKFNSLSQSMSAMESVIVTESSRREDSQLRLYAQLSLQGETLVAIERKVLRLETQLQQHLTNNSSRMTRASNSIQRSAASDPLESSSSAKQKSPSRRKNTKKNASSNMPLPSASVASGVNVTDFIMEDMVDMKSGTSASIVSRMLDDNNEPPAAGNLRDRPRKGNAASTTAPSKQKRGRPPKEPKELIAVTEAVPTATTPGKKKRGRPRIYPIGVEVNQPEQPSATAAIAATTTATTAATTNAESGRKKRGPYKKWSEGDNYKAIEKALGISATGTEGTNTESEGILPVPRSTLYSIKKRMKSEQFNLDEIFSGRTTGLTTVEQRKKISDIICSRDKENNNITRKEVIQMIMDATQANHAKAADHLDYLVRKKKLPNLIASKKRSILDMAAGVEQQNVITDDILRDSNHDL
mmetsp:Transcript_5557/g.8196  ORF Transcript_5557/g.8196 Transcript_5557/m.8196 type:complete len:440 (+) Transcript_5557:58-1377(+)|eukprot:CAMPEP_0172431486 /NCGR_PEP_ID=MMETSP1064-20121228/58710_1 /TAXON_ID=202472 /ORGANISM="Aulacoseira subarctica , Strain CCAP 1002/5" /LENGTH=439 /DNA_ID=CAMNT_0013178205 /DNA_START=38 /DNA_END=1357 /DNA_ORIENTATION=+